jgi:inorganic pyrophosphatase
MRIYVFVQNDAGSRQKNYHNEKTRTWLYSVDVSHAYPYPYGFILGTTAPDGGNVDCFVITRRQVAANQTIECEPIGLMEQYEGGIVDHNVLARPVGEPVEISEEARAALTEHVTECVRHLTDKTVTVGQFLPAAPAEAYIKRHRDPQIREHLRWFVRGAAGAVIASFPLAGICALVFRFPIPLFGYAGGFDAMIPAMMAVVFYGMFGGFPLQALLGGIGGLVGARYGRPDEVRMRKYSLLVSVLCAVPGIVALATLDYIVGRW